MDKTLEELIRLAAAGDATATTQLLNAYSGVALDWARQMVGDEALAQNIAQNSLITALTNLGTLQDPSQFEPWLKSIVGNMSASAQGAGGAGMTAAAQTQPGGQAYQGQPGQQPYQAQPGQQPYQGQPGGQPYQGQPGGQPYPGQPVLQQNSPQGGKKKGGSKVIIGIAAAVVLILLCVGGGIFAGRYIAGKRAEETAVELLAEGESIPEEGETAEENMPQGEDAGENTSGADTSVEVAVNNGTTASAENGVNAAVQTDGQNAQEPASSAADTTQSTAAETTAAATQAAPIVIVINESGAAASNTAPVTQSSGSSGTTTTINTGSSSLNAIAQKALANGGYVLPQSNSRYYSASELNALTADELRVARNEIYARHGRMFDSDDLRAYFNSMPWYRGTVSASSFKDSVFNAYEKSNIDAIKAAEARK